jgi:hypothetical protein
MRKTLRYISMVIALVVFATLVWANRTGKFLVKPFNYGGELIKVPESAELPKDVIPVKVGMFVENVYDFNLTTQSAAAEVVMWVNWPEAFQAVLDRTNMTIEQAITPINRVNSWDFVARPFHAKPVRLSNGNYEQIIRFGGRFYVDRLNLHRFPFERVSVPIVLGVNFISDAFSASKVRLIADRSQSGVGPYVDNMGFATDGFSVNEYLQKYATGFGFHESGRRSSTEFSQVRVEIEYRKSKFASLQQLIVPLLIVMLMVLLAPTLGAALWDVRIAIPSTALLTLVFLQQGYRQALPMLPYITYLDQVYGACYLVTFGLFSLFVWTSNKLHETPESEREAMIKRLNVIDYRAQWVCIIFLVVSIVFNYLNPLQ